jgi:hypothetical protein
MPPLRAAPRFLFCIVTIKPIKRGADHIYIYISTMASKAKRSAAMAKFRSAKRKRDLGEEDEDVFDSNMKEEDDVYDVVDEEEYKTLVESRRQREDFVVDDGTFPVLFVCLFAGFAAVEFTFATL